MSSHKNKLTILFIIIIVIITTIGILIFNYLQNNSTNQTNSDTLPFTKEEIALDFINKEKILQSDVTPPLEIKNRYAELINNSLAAIESGIPSLEQFKDLSDDYSNLGSSYNILGDYVNAEKYYFQGTVEFPNKYLLQLNLGTLYATMQQYQDSANQFYNVMELFPNDYRVYEKLADLYLDYSISEDKLDKADQIYATGIKNADDPKTLYKRYAYFLENELKDYERALWAEREYQKISGNKAEQEIERLKRMIGD